MTAVEQIKQHITKSKRFVLLSHVHTDGDALGSLIALYHYLVNNGKQVSIMVPGDLPKKYAYLDSGQLINQGDFEWRLEQIADADVAFILDISKLSRLDIYHDAVRGSNAYKIIIDHHPVEKGWADLAITDTGRIATAEMIFEIFEQLKADITRPMAVALYTAILSDSGSFRFTKTGASTFKMAARLVQAGVEPSELYGRVFETARREQIMAWGSLLSTLQRKGPVSYIKIDKEFIQKRQMPLHEFDGLIDIMRKEQDASVFIVFIEKEHDEILVGLRARNGVDVGQVARQFGGGGHYHAAGFTSYQNLENTVKFTLKVFQNS